MGMIKITLFKFFYGDVSFDVSFALHSGLLVASDCFEVLRRLFNHRTLEKQNSAVTANFCEDFSFIISLRNKIQL